MVISHSYKFIFVAVPKTASTSVGSAIDEYGQDSGLAKHLTALNACKQYGKIWDEYFKFSFVRNPWDWLVSWYMYRKRDALKDPGHPNHKNYTGSMSFEDFLRRDYPAVRKTQRSRISDHQGKLLVDYVGRYENLGEDMNLISTKIGIPAVTLPHLFRSVRREYREYYTDTTRQLVIDHYREDIDFFEYSF